MRRRTGSLGATATSAERSRVDVSIRSIAIPAAAALATEPLFELCDVAILASIGTEALGGASLAIRLLAFGHGIFVFLLFGTTAAVARRVGAADRRGAAAESVTAMWIAAAIGLAATAVMLLSGRWLISVLGGHGAVGDAAWTYLWISALGLAGFTMTMTGVGVSRGQLNTRLPLVVAAVASAANLIVDLILVVWLDFGVAAAAFTTTAAKVGSAAVYLRLIIVNAKAAGAALVPTLSSIRAQLVVGRDLIVRTVLLRGSLMAAQSIAAYRGATQLAAFAIAFQIWMFTAYAADGLETAGQSLVAHRLGANDRASATTESAPPPLRLIVARLARYGAALGAVVGIALLMLAPVLPRLFSSDPQVLEDTTTALRWIGAISIVSPVGFIGDGILVGAGRQRFLAIVMALATAAFAAVAWIWHDAASGQVVWAAISAMLLVRCAGAVIGVSRIVAQDAAPGLSTPK